LALIFRPIVLEPPLWTSLKILLFIIIKETLKAQINSKRTSQIAPRRHNGLSTEINTWLIASLQCLSQLSENCIMYVEKVGPIQHKALRILLDSSESSVKVSVSVSILPLCVSLTSLADAENPLTTLSAMTMTKMNGRMRPIFGGK